MTVKTEELKKIKSKTDSKSKSGINYFDATIYSDTEVLKNKKEVKSSSNKSSNQVNIENKIEFNIDDLKYTLDNKNVDAVKNYVNAPKFTKRLKLAVSTYASVMALVAFLTIYNVFSLNSIDSDINALNSDIAQSEQALNQISIERLIKDVGNITDDEIIDVAEGLGFSSDLNSSSIQGYDSNEPFEYVSPTNWFDRVVNFFSNLFN